MISKKDVSSLTTGKPILLGVDGEGDWLGDSGGEICEAMINGRLTMGHLLLIS